MTLSTPLTTVPSAGGRHRAGTTASPGVGDRAGETISGAVLLAVGTTAACLRSPVTAVGAELAALRAELGLSPLVVGTLTALPLVVFAVAGVAAPAVRRRLGARTAVLGGLGVIAVGLVVRALVDDAAGLLAATVVVLAAVGVVNVVLPPATAARSSWATGVFSLGVLCGIAAPAALAVPFGATTGLGWRAGIGVWAALALVALAVWGATYRVLPRREGRAVHDRPTVPFDRRSERRPVALTVFFAAQSLGAFAVMGYLPQVYRDAGLDPATASVLLATTVALALPAALLLPGAVRRGGTATARALVVVVGVAQVGGLAGLLLAPVAGAWVWALLLTAAHCGFPLAMALLARRPTRDRTRLSAVVQSGGYALGAAGPLALGPLHEATGTWSAALAVLAAVAAVQLVAGLHAARVDTTAPPAIPAGPAPARSPHPEDAPRDRDHPRPRPPHAVGRRAPTRARHRRPGAAARRPGGRGRPAQQRRDDPTAAGHARRGDGDAR